MQCFRVAMQLVLLGCETPASRDRHQLPRWVLFLSSFFRNRFGSDREYLTNLGMWGGVAVVELEEDRETLGFLPEPEVAEAKKAEDPTPSGPSAPEVSFSQVYIRAWLAYTLGVHFYLFVYF